MFKIEGFEWYIFVFCALLIAVLMIVRKRIRKNKERSMTPNFSTLGLTKKPVEEPIKKAEEKNNDHVGQEGISLKDKWDEIQRNMDIYGDYAILEKNQNGHEYCFSASGLMVMKERGWRLYTVDDEAYYFERVAGGPV